MKFHSVTAGLIDQVPEIRFNHRCHGNREKGIRRATSELVSGIQQGRSFSMPMFHDEEYHITWIIMNIHELSCVMRIHQNEWISRIWCLDSPWAFLGGSLAARYTIRRFLSKLSQHPLGSALRFLTWQGGYKKCRPRPCRLKKHIHWVDLHQERSRISFILLVEQKNRFRGVCTFLSSVFERISRLTFYCQAVWNHQNALAEWCRSLFVSSKCGHFRIRILLLVALVAPGRVPNRQENSLRPDPNVALNFESETSQKKKDDAKDRNCSGLRLHFVSDPHCSVWCAFFSLQCLNDLRQSVPLLLPRIAMSSEGLFYSGLFY